MDLRIAVKQEYFDAMKTGEKTEEYRLVNPYWSKRLDRRTYDKIIITAGYPKAADQSRTIVFPYNGYVVKDIRHEHFGPEPVRVYALKLNKHRLYA